jgi:hypothetical protein
VTVAILRTEAGRDPQNKELHDLIGELSTRSEEFRRRWGAHNVRHHGATRKRRPARFRKGRAWTADDGGAVATKR